MKRSAESIESKQTTGPLPKKFKEDPKGISNPVDSSDESQGHVEEEFESPTKVNTQVDYVSKIAQRATELTESVSYILTDISNRLLLNKEVSEKYRQVKNPLKVKLDFLNEKKFLYENIKISLDKLENDIKIDTEITEQLKKVNNDSINEIVKRINSRIYENQQSLNKLLKDSMNYLIVGNNAKSTDSGKTEISKDEVPSPETKDNSNNTGNQLSGQVIKLLNNINEEIKSLNTLQLEKVELNKMLKGALPFIPKKLKPTFIEEYNKYFGLIKTEAKIVEELITFREKITENKVNVTNDKDYVEKLGKLFNITIKGKQDSYQQSTLNPMREKIEDKIGRGPSDNDVKRYIELHQEEDIIRNFTSKETEEKKKEKEKIDYIKDLVGNYIKINSNEIYKTLKASDVYTTDFDYLKELSKQDYVVQIRAYRKLNRDIEKFVILSGEEGLRNVTPGSNTTSKITSGGSTVHQVHELGSYVDIGENHIKTLQNFTEYMSGTRTTKEEKEKEFRTLSQVEAIRNTSALLTNAMFFELAKDGFQPVRSFWKEKKYDFKEIADQMPMAMKCEIHRHGFN